MRLDCSILIKCFGKHTKMEPGVPVEITSRVKYYQLSPRLPYIEKKSVLTDYMSHRKNAIEKKYSQNMTSYRKHHIKTGFYFKDHEHLFPNLVRVEIR